MPFHRDPSQAPERSTCGGVAGKFSPGPRLQDKHAINGSSTVFQTILELDLDAEVCAHWIFVGGRKNLHE